MRIPVGQLPGIGALVKDYFDSYEKVASFYNGDYRKPEEFLNRVAGIKARSLPLSRLVPILKEQNQSYGCGLETLEKIDWLLERRACAVVTGQQTGLLTGPLFTIYKALTAIKLAARLSRNCEGCFIPVFWLASDDHDFREVNHCKILDKSNQVQSITYGEHPADARVPVAAVTLAQSISAALQQLDDSTHPSEFKEEVLETARNAYAPETGFATAFACLLMRLFRPFGLVIVDASEPRMKALAGDLFLKEISEDSPSTRAAMSASEELINKGYPTQVGLKEGFLNLFYTETERSAIEYQGDRFNIRGQDQAFSRDDLIRLAKEKPEYFSPNVLLRPLYQDALLPTIAYVAGPAEIAYYAQMKGIYQRFDMPMPIIYPRKSLTLLEGRVEKVLDNYKLKITDFFGDVEALITEVAKSQLPDSLEKRVENAGLCIEKNIQALEQVVSEFDPTLVDFVKSTKGRIQGQIDGLEKKVLQAFKKRNDVIRQQIYKAGSSLYPDGALQERQLNVIPYLFKYGFGFIDQLFEAMDISNCDHQIVKI